MLNNNYETNKIVALINSQSGQINSDMLNDLIKSDKTRSEKLKKSYSEYGLDVNIKNRRFVNPTKLNNKLANNFRGLITTQLTSYFLGNGIQYKIDDKTISDYIDKILRRNNIADLDYTTGEICSACGEAYRLLYIDKNAKERLMNINPWEVIFIKDETLDEVQYAMIYYKIEIKEGTQSYTVYRVEWYDKETVTYYIQDKQGNFYLDTTENENPQSHLFKEVPIIKFSNNNLDMSDYESVSTLIDSYDKTISDVQNEIEEFRLAYIAFYGVEPTPETMSLAKQTGAFSFKQTADGKSGDVKFITKQIDATFIENHKKTLEKNILKFASVVDYSDDSFAGTAVSAASRKLKMKAQEDITLMKERKFAKSLYDMFKVLSTFWSIKNINLDYEDMKFIFSRSMPNEFDASNLQQYVGIISNQTILENLSFVKDVNQELERLKNEKEESGKLISLDDISGNANDINR